MVRVVRVVRVVRMVRMVRVVRVVRALVHELIKTLIPLIPRMFHHFYGKHSWDKSVSCFLSLSRFLQSRQMLWLGGLSFEIYLLHMPLLRIQNSLWNSLQLEQDTILHIFVFILLLILSSHSVKMASHIFRKK